MISKTYFRDILTVVGLAIVLTIFLTRPVFSQDTTKMKGDKKVRIVAKIVEDKNGKRQEFDTTINLDRN
jgi:type III secretory pathway component EscR